MQKILIVPDVHSPFEDIHAWQLVLKVARVLKPNIIITCGDLIDNYQVSAHRKDPRRKLRLEDEIESAFQRLLDLDALGAKRKIFIAGNHEYRLERYLMDRAPELLEFVKIEELLHLRGYGWEYVPYKDFIKVGKVLFTHDLGFAGKYVAQRALIDAQHSVVIGHAHRFTGCVEGDARGKRKVAHCFGWLGDAKKADYMHRLKANREWALGFGIGYLHTNGSIYFDAIPILSDYSCVFNGKRYKV